MGALAEPARTDAPSEAPKPAAPGNNRGIPAPPAQPAPEAPDPKYDLKIPKHGGPFQALQEWNKHQPKDQRLTVPEMIAEARKIRDEAFKSRSEKSFKQGETLHMSDETVAKLKERASKGAPDAPAPAAQPKVTDSVDDKGTKTRTTTVDGKVTETDSLDKDNVRTATKFNADQSVKEKVTTKPDGTVETVENDEKGQQVSRTVETTDPKTGEKTTNGFGPGP